MFVRKAFVSDLDTILELIYYSEKSLNFDEKYMMIFKDKYNINKEFLENSYSYCMIESNNIVGFFALQYKNNLFELEYFYIKHNLIGKGYGKVMFEFLIKKCNELNIKEFYLVTSPESLEFYSKLGAKKVSEAKSLIDANRIIPRLKYIVNGGC